MQRDAMHRSDMAILSAMLIFMQCRWCACSQAPLVTTHASMPNTTYRTACSAAGYFTSRAASKGWIRSSTSFLQAVRQLEVLSRFASGVADVSRQGSDKLNPLIGPDSDALEEVVALLQHHDAITGTEKQHVANDYHRRLQAGRGLTSASAQLQACSIACHGADIAAIAICYAIHRADSAAMQPADMVACMHVVLAERPMQCANPYRQVKRLLFILSMQYDLACTRHITECKLEYQLLWPYAHDARHVCNVGLAAAKGSYLKQLGALIGAELSSGSPAQLSQAHVNDGHTASTAPSSSSAAVQLLALATATEQHTVRRQMQQASGAEHDSAEQQKPVFEVPAEATALLNVSICGPTVELSGQNKGFWVAVHNPLAWPRQELVRVPIKHEAARGWNITGGA